MNETPITDLEPFWKIKALSIEWLYVLDTLARTTVPEGQYNEKEPQFMIGQTMGDDPVPLYMLRKTIFPAETIAKVTGLEVDALLATTGEIYLRSAKVEGLPDPTVNYWGRA